MVTLQERKRRHLSLILLVATVVALAAFHLSAAGSAAQATATVSVRQKDPFGSYLADASGKTLYTLSSDPAGQSTCTGMCTTAWPPLMLASGNPSAPAGFTGSLSVISRSDGGRQVAYNNQALYTFVRDANAGDTNGEGVNAFGGTWHVAKLTAGAAAPSASALPASGTGGLVAARGDHTQVFGALALSALTLGFVAFVLYRQSAARDGR